MYHYEKNIQKNLPEGPREHVWKPRENVSPGPAVVLDGPGNHNQRNTAFESANQVTVLSCDVVLPL